MLLGVSVLLFNIQLTKAFGTIYIRADGSIDPPSAPIDTADNITYAFTGDMNDSVVVERSNIIIDGAGHVVNGSGTGIGFRLANINNVTIKNANIKNFEYGVHLLNSSDNTVSGNNITNTWCGILIASSDNVISSNKITANAHYGIWLFSSDNVLRNNSMAGNRYNFRVYGPIILITSDLVNDVDSSNTVDGKPVYYWVNRQDMNVPPDAGYVALINCTNITVQNLNLTKNQSGTYLFSTTNSTIIQNNMINNQDGIWLYYSSNNNIIGNKITANRNGISFLEYSSNNSVTGNSIKYNTKGIHSWFSSNNKIHHNNFINNTEQGDVGPPGYYASSWGQGYPSGGNYWSDYNGTDFFSGSGQNQTGSDGICDTPYTIDANNTDNYPLLGMFSSFNATSEYNVQTVCNSSISDFRFNGTAVSFNVTGEEGTVGFCRMLIPTALMNETYRVFVNGTEVSYDLLPFSNATHSYLYFAYNHSTQEVVIIPEFPSLIILPLFMIATLLAVIAYRREQRTRLRT